MKYLLLSIVLLFSNLSFAKLNYCEGKTENKTYESFKIDRDKLFSFLSNHKDIASKADATLSKLLNAKSPIITKWIANRNLSDEIAIVKAWRKYYLEQFVLNQFSKAPRNIKDLVYKKADHLYKKHINKKVKFKFDSDFTKAKSLVKQVIESSNINKKEKNIILKRIKQIKLNYAFNLETSKLKDKPLDVLQWTLNYDPAPNKINVGLDALRYSDSANRVSIFAHEIAHSFDPCRYNVFVSKNTPFKTLIKCLRTETAAGAKKRDDKHLLTLLNKKKISKDLYYGLKLNPLCNKTLYPPLGVQREQINEVFADWVSAEAMALPPKTSSSFRNDLCENKKLNAGSSYLSNLDRLKRVYLAQPKLKKYFYPKNKFKYCSLAKGST